MNRELADKMLEVIEIIDVACPSARGLEDSICSDDRDACNDCWRDAIEKYNSREEK